ncbi:mate-domain-containing protein [Gilbertella persicaria]|uniref:mate-domain-containing protein n=1 Tax=Gilbertella persicaria TaxID=101096 RepID=UPI00222013A8|nr:mate-domain-containing protein [Gilbertella persicaria]KAI8098278.1 mate-domain-containing protein [Gilbertella persicaria]
MFRVPTLINLPKSIWKENGQTMEQRDSDIDETTSLLPSKSEKFDSYYTRSQSRDSVSSSSLPSPVTNDISFYYPNTYQLDLKKDIKYFWSHTRVVRQELTGIIRFCIPLIITFLLGVGNRVVDVWFLGKIGAEAMAVASLGNLFTMVTGLSIGYGVLTEAIDTLVAQAFTGASNPHTVGAILQRGLVIMYLFGLGISILWAFSDKILLAMGQSPELAEMAHKYIVIVIPNIFLSFTTVAIRKFLQGLGEMKVTMYLVFVLFPVNIASNYFFLIYLNLGYIGAAYHHIFFSVFLLFVYILFISSITSDIKKFWPGLSMQAFQYWGEFLKLGIPGMLSVSTDWAFEVCAIITGLLGQTSLAAQSVLISCNTLLLMIPTALTTALSVRLGHHLGANKPVRTKLCVILACAIGSILVTMNATLLYVYRSAIAHTFSTDTQVIAAIEELMGIGSLCHLMMGISTVLSGTLNAFGKQHIVAAFNIITYYIIGLPFGVYMTSKHELGLIGIWSGVALSGLLKCLCEGFFIVFYINFDTECANAAKRINKQEI